jgi:protein-disulfide isomerase-like protein with CxxC motif
MNTTVINTEKQLKDFVSQNRKNITNINGVEFGEMYPMMEVTNKQASYYDVETQGNKFLYAPFKVEFNA